MANELTLEVLRKAVAGTAAAFRCRRTLQPAGGPGDKVFPPTYAGAVPIERLPAGLKVLWTDRVRPGELLKIGLQDSDALLKELDDPLASRFEALFGQHSPLTSRDQSILAHGFSPVGEGVFKQFLRATLELGGIEETILLGFPRLPEWSEGSFSDH